MKRRTVSLSAKKLAALDRIVRKNRTHLIGSNAQGIKLLFDVSNTSATRAGAVGEPLRGNLRVGRTT